MKNNIIKSGCNGLKATGGWRLAPGKMASDFGLRSSVSNLRSSDFGLLTFAVLLISTILLSSCEDVIEVKLNDENLNLFGVEAGITTQDEPTVFLYKTLKVNQDEAYPGVSGAVVILSDNAAPANSISLVEDQQKKGMYRIPHNKSFKGVAGREYTLTIQSQGVTLTAKDKLTKVEPIDSIQVFPSMRGNKLFLGIFSYGKEPKGLGNYYKWDVFINDTLVHDADRLAIASDEFVDGNYISKLEIYTDFHDPKKPEDRRINLKDKIYIKQSSISEFAYYYYFQMINQSSTGSLFSVPSANIKSNFISSDGKPVLGLFVARDVSVSNTVVIDQAIEDQLRKP
ncbi:MAG TPA: hypothetical protein DCR40_20995 [Prolixibacteraceae bacterium]|nr:hypothetical protein [Prolixibacteraceae bacterium]